MSRLQSCCQVDRLVAHLFPNAVNTAPYPATDIRYRSYAAGQRGVLITDLFPRSIHATPDPTTDVWYRPYAAR
jgi:hypothetical protein